MSASWLRTTLGQLADFRNGLNYTQAARHGGGLPIVGVKDFQDRTLVEYADLEELDADTVTAGESTLQKDDILFVRSNGNRNLIGRSLFVEEQPSRPTTFSGFTIRLRFRRKEAHPRFFAYLLRGPIIRQTLSSRGGGTNISNLNQGLLAALVVPLPPYEDQQRIANILSAYDDLIEVNRRRVAILEDMAQRLFEEWFVHLRFPGHATTPLNDTPNGPVPDGWRYLPLAAVADVNRASIRPTDTPDTIRYVDISSVSPGKVEHAQVYAFADAPGRARRLVQDGSIIWSTVRPNRRGFAFIVDPEPDLVVSTGFAVIDAFAVPASYLYAWTTTDAFVSYLVNHATGAAYPAVTGATFKRAQVLVPPEDLASDYARQAAPMLRLAGTLNYTNTHLAATRDLLLSHLLSGQPLIATPAPTLLAAE